MPGRIRSCIKFLIAVCLVVSFCLVEGNAQTRRKKRTRRSAPAAPKPVITNPPIAPPDATSATDAAAPNDDVKIISQADSPQDSSQPATKKAVIPTNTNEKEEMQQTITTLSNQVNRLNDKLSQIQED